MQQVKDQRRELIRNYYGINNNAEEFMSEKEQMLVDEETYYYRVTFLVSNGIEELWRPELIYRQKNKIEYRRDVRYT